VQLQRTVSVLSLLLSLAESLDRGHARLVHTANVRPEDDQLVLQLSCQNDCQLELWALRGHERAVAKVLGMKLAVEVLPQGEG
jgi:hypothetical protein